MIDIRCFGTFELSGQQGRLGPADLGGPKPRRLLELLVLARGELVSKGRLLDEIWGSARRPANPSGTIESYVSGLRKAALRVAGTPLIITEAGAYRIDMAVATIDLDRFDELVAAARRDPSARESLEAAFNLAKRELFAGEPHEGLIARAREQYRALALQVGLDAAMAAASAGEWRGAFSHAIELLTDHATSEPASEIAMTAAYRLGRRNDALALFERCRAALSDDLDCEPGPRLIELHGAIQRRLPDSDLPELPRVFDSAVSARDVTPAVQFAAGSALAGIDDRIRSAVDLDSALRAGLDAFAVVAVEGEFGTGKSGTLERIAAHPPAGFRHSELVVASELFGAAPLAPLLHAVHDVMAPELDAAGISRGVMPGSHPLDVLEHLVTALRAHAPMLLVVDQFECADDATARAIPYLRERCADVGGVILVAWDPSITAAHRPHHDLRLDVRIELGRFTPDELPRHEVDLLWERTGGLPLLVEGLLDQSRGARDARSSHAQSSDETRDWSPRCERRVIGRFRRLGDDLLSVATVAAALDEPFDAMAVARVLDRDPLEVLERCDTMMHAGVLTAVDLRFAFRDVLVREILVSQVSAARLLWMRELARPGSQVRRPAGAVGIASR